MLIKQLKELAAMYTLQIISFNEIEYLSGLTKDKLPKEFFKYAEECNASYKAYCESQEKNSLQGSDFDIDKHPYTSDGKPCPHLQK